MYDMSLTLRVLADHVGGRVVGDADVHIERIANLQNAKTGDIVFLANAKFKKLLPATLATAVILNEKDLSDCPTNAIVVGDPHVAYAKIAALFVQKQTTKKSGVHPSAVIGGGAKIHSSAYIGPLVVIEEGVTIGARAIVGPGCVIGRNAQIGSDTELVARVTICHGSILGSRVLVHPGVVIGSDGFGLANDAGRWIKVPQLGKAVIGDDVEIGANSTIDRGALDDTVLEDGVKLDNLVHVAHNVRIGANTAIAAKVGIAGSTKIGKNCTIGGAVGIGGHLTIADNVYLTGMSMVTKSITESGAYSSGMPAEPNHEWRRHVVRLRNLDKWEQRLKTLEAQLGTQAGES